MIQLLQSIDAVTLHVLTPHWEERLYLLASQLGKQGERNGKDTFKILPNEDKNG